MVDENLVIGKDVWPEQLNPAKGFRLMHCQALYSLSIENPHFSALAHFADL
jgi:hypothetical protein